MISDAEYKAISDQQLQEITAIQAQIGRNHLDTDHLRAETRRLREEAQKAGEENRVLIARLRAML